MSHPIICFEGPSAIGKTTLSNLFSETFDTIPEVNLLFHKEKNASKYWYYEKQVQRYQLCKSTTRGVILDGDPFQPLWYNWIYGYPPKFCSKEETYQFYRQQIFNQQIAFPDHYIIFETTREELLKRKTRDKSRQRRNFDKHLQFIPHQKTYFSFLKNYTPLQISFLPFDKIETTKAAVQRLISQTAVRPKKEEQIFDDIINWLEQTKVDT